MEVKKIYFDMDGVLADFDRGIRELCGVEPIDQDVAGDSDRIIIWGNASKIPHYYDRLELIPGAKEMFDTVYNAYGDRCEILTGIPKPDKGMKEASEDKIAWVRRLLSDKVVIHTIYREQKLDYCTGEDCILIDDLKRNIEPWEERGGTGILHTDAESTLRKLRELGIL